MKEDKEPKLCPKCNSHDFVKHGKVKNVQRFLCRNCHYHFTVTKKGKELENIYKVKALQLYLEGLSLRTIEKFLGVSYVTISKWVNKYGPLFNEIKLSEEKLIIEQVDELNYNKGLHKNKPVSGLLFTGIGGKNFIVRKPDIKKD